MFNIMVDFEVSIEMGVFAWLFVNYLTDQGEIFSFWRIWISRLPEKMAKPIGLCAMCTAGFWTLVIKLYDVRFFILGFDSFSILLFYVHYAVASAVLAAGVAVLLTKFIGND